MNHENIIKSGINMFRDEYDRQLISMIAAEAIIEAGYEVARFEKVEDRFFVDFIKFNLSISTSFDNIYNPETDDVKYHLHFYTAGQPEENFEHNNFPGLGKLLQNNVLPNLKKANLVSGATILSDTSDSCFIISPDPLSIINLNIILLDILQGTDNFITVDEGKMHAWTSDKKDTLPTMEEYFDAFAVKAKARVKAQFSHRDPGTSDKAQLSLGGPEVP